MHGLHGWTAARTLALLALLAACGDDGGDDSFAGDTMPGITGASATATPTSGASGESGGATSEPTTGAASVSEGTTDTPEPTTGAMTSMTTTMTMTTTSDTTTSDATTGAPSEFFMLADPLIDGTVGAPVGGAFGPEGWTVTGDADRVYWEVPTLSEGSVAFTVKNITLDNLPLNDHEIFAMYEGGHETAGSCSGPWPCTSRSGIPGRSRSGRRACRSGPCFRMS